LRATFAYSHLDTKYQDVRDLLGNDITANFIPIQAPKNQANLAVDYRLVDTPVGTVEFNANYAWTDKVHKSTTAADALITTLPAVGILNASVSVSPSERLRVTAWVKNLADKAYITNVFNGNSQLNVVAGREASQQQVYWGEPRMYGLTLTYKFGKQ
jgi:outer membrane receptor protein involved in Fe transport